MVTAQHSAAQQRRSVIAGLVVSASTGKFRCDSLPAATYLVQARGVLDQTPITSVEVGEREQSDLQVKLGEPPPNRLPDPVTTGHSPPDGAPPFRLPEEFVERKKLGIGQFLAGEEIARRRPPSVVDVFRSFRGMEVRCRSGICTPHVVRTPPNCAPKVYVDRAGADAGILRGIDPDNLQAVEVSLGVSEYPNEYPRNPSEARCGLIVIWTRFTPVRRK